MSGTRPNDATGGIRDRRALAAIAAAVIAAALGVGQLWLGQATGVLAWRGNASTTGTIDEAAIVIWLTAAAVSLGAAAPMLIARAPLTVRRKVLHMGLAVFGACLTAPVATAIAAWSQMYGGDLSQLRITRLVAYGVVLGGLAAWVSVRSQAAAWSLLYWIVMGWILMWGSASVAPNISPILGHLDPGPEWSTASRQWQARMVLIAIAVVLGVAVGAAARLLGWWRNRRGLPGQVSRFTSTATGPGLMLAAYLVAAALDGQIRPDAVVNLATAVLVAAVSACLGVVLARHVAFTHARLS
ncbi:hypothetical protein FB566_3179 [Stackebrandtia endophytica]|uniref:Uncharacterized protein n=1 Tax=Stackebrandtia endophytica TaxID=1496996 RepID=A0A543AYG9_9ACTN|nr:hypothetical protein [Stackebrandtia endophytica]TQL77619.1 hypothetical protein FB566_3179 [Stackebrandtia endophytica]